MASEGPAPVAKGSEGPFDVSSKKVDPVTVPFAAAKGKEASTPAPPEREDSTSIIPVAQRKDGLGFLALRNLRDRLTPQASPFVDGNNMGAGFVGDQDLVQISIMRYESEKSTGALKSDLVDSTTGAGVALPDYALRSGARPTVYQDPKAVSAAIVTCGGLCPGLNDVVQNIVSTLLDYGVPDDQIFGIKFGLRGFLDRSSKPVILNRQTVDGIHLRGGTVLGTSRGNAKMHEIVERMRLWGITMLFVIGGNGGNAAAHAIAKECEAQGHVCNVVGVPKSIDNDIQLIDRCFGFDTAVEEAQRSLKSARVEARSTAGVAIVKLMGRSSGFISMNASMASGTVDICLIPEIEFTMTKLKAYVTKLLARKSYCVICVAEGAGQSVVEAEGVTGTDPSGNPILKDIGAFLRDELAAALPDREVMYIDPSYMIRSIPTVTTDRILCKVLGQGAVHGAFAGYTDFTVGSINTHYVYLPTTTIIQTPRTVDPQGRTWNRLKTAISQPDLF